MVHINPKYKQFSGDLLLTLACPVGCDFCLYSSRPSRNRREWMKTATIKRIAEQFSENDIGIRVCGGEPFYDTAKLDECLDILSHYYEPETLSVITSGFWATNEKRTKKNIGLLKKRGLTDLAVSTDRFHLEKIPLQNIIRILECSKDAGLEIVLGLTLDDLSRPHLPAFGELIAKHRARMVLHEWSPFGRAGTLDTSCLGNFEKIKRELLSLIRSYSKKYGSPTDPDSYFAIPCKRSQFEYGPLFYPTAFPDGRVFACPIATRGTYLGDIRRQGLSAMLASWKGTFIGSILLSRTKDCSRLYDMSPKKVENCITCLNAADNEKIPFPRGWRFVDINERTNMAELFNELRRQPDGCMISLKPSICNNSGTAKHAIRLFRKLGRQKVPFKLSRPVPKCATLLYQTIVGEFNTPSGCYDCYEMFRLNNNKKCVEFCSAAGGARITLKGSSTRKEIYDQFKKIHECLPLNPKCKSCIYLVRNQCNGLCFRGQAGAPDI